MSTGVRRPVLTRHWITDELRRRVIVGELLPGQWLRQEEIANEFGTSQGPVREAFRTLAGEGFIEHETHRGYRVTTFTETDLREIAEVRELLETEAIRRAVPRLTNADRAALQEAHVAMSRFGLLTPDGDQRRAEEFRSAHERFHTLIFEACGLPRLADLVIAQWRHAQRMRTIALRDQSESAAHADDDHATLLAACMAGDADGAVEAMRAHRAAASETAIQALRGSQRALQGA